MHKFFEQPFDLIELYFAAKRYATHLPQTNLYSVCWWQNTTEFDQNTPLNNRCKILIHSLFGHEKFMIYHCLIQVLTRSRVTTPRCVPPSKYFGCFCFIVEVWLIGRVLKRCALYFSTIYTRHVCCYELYVYICHLHLFVANCPRYWCTCISCHHSFQTKFID